MDAVYSHVSLSYLLNFLEYMENYEFINIIKHLVQEKKDLQERLDIMEEILHSYIPVIEKKEKDNE